MTGTKNNDLVGLGMFLLIIGLVIGFSENAINYRRTVFYTYVSPQIQFVPAPSGLPESLRCDRSSILDLGSNSANLLMRTIRETSERTAAESQCCLCQTCRDS